MPTFYAVPSLQYEDHPDVRDYGPKGLEEAAALETGLQEKVKLLPRPEIYRKFNPASQVPL